MIEMNWCVTMPMPLLDIHSLTFTVDHLAILERLDLAIESHEIHAILGANGSGKTTLMAACRFCDTRRSRSEKARGHVVRRD